MNEKNHPARGTVLLLGPPGAGKSTQAGILAQKYGLTRINSGSLLRQEAARGTAWGIEALACMRVGAPVPDRIVTALVLQAEALATGAAVVLDGYPQSVEQARLLEPVLAARDGAVLVVVFETTLDTLRARLTGRADGGRPDEDPATIEARLRRAPAVPDDLRRFYAASGVLRTLDADRPLVMVTERLDALVSAELGLSAGTRLEHTAAPQAEADRASARIDGTL